MTEEIIKQIQDTLRPYIDHTKTCSTVVNASNPDGDYCTCNVRFAIRKANELAGLLVRIARAKNLPPVDASCSCHSGSVCGPACREGKCHAGCHNAKT